MKLDNAHWTHEGYTQRVTTEDWKMSPLTYENKIIIIIKGHLRQLKIKSLGAGVMEIYKESLKTD